jgi:hypothetical protein
VPRRPSVVLVAGLAVLALLDACGSEPSPLNPAVNCKAPTPVVLAVGQSLVLDASQNKGCIELPAAGPGGASHLVVALSGSGQVASGGIFGRYALGAKAKASPAPPVFDAAAIQAAAPDPAARFHAALRQRESELAVEPGRRITLPRITRQVPPAVGDQRTFRVCGNVSCNSFVNVTATAKLVGPHGAIFLDNTVPANGLTQTDLDSLGSMFDGASPNIYEIDTTAFGHESDLDGNGRIIVLLTDQVNTLSGNCPHGDIILGYFFGLDLVSDPNSNGGEVFYGLVPNPAAATCNVTRAQVVQFLPPVLAHEFQHMLSFNQHVLSHPQGTRAEVTWLNEGLSHFAEEIAGRGLSNSRCPGFATCLHQFTDNGDLPNAYSYLSDPERHFLVYPSNSFGTLPERGASWLFVRWLVDHFAADTLIGTDLTRSLTMTDLTGAANVTSVTGVAFSQLVSYWQMANYTEQFPAFAASGLLRYRTWDLESAFGAAVGLSYPLFPDLTSGLYAEVGTLRGGSGHHLVVNQPANAAAIDLQLDGTTNFHVLIPRLAVVRLQ